MIDGFVRYIELQARHRTGLNGPVLAWGSAAAVGAAVTFSLVIVAAFIWLAERYSPLTAALVLAGFFLLLTIVALIACQIMHGRTVEKARVELAARAQQPWLDPRYLGTALQVGRSIGMRRLLPLIGVGLVAAGLAKEWGHWSGDKPEGEGGD